MARTDRIASHNQFTMIQQKNDFEAFPVIEDEMLKTIEPCFTIEEFTAGAEIITAGTKNYDCFFVLSGNLQVLDVSSDEPVEVVVHSEGQFTGDIDMLTGRPSVVSIIAHTDARCLRLPANKLPELFICQPSIGDIMVKAFVRRRTLLLHSGFSGIRLFGDRDSADSLLLQEFFYRNGVPHMWMDVRSPETRKRMDAIGISDDELPVLSCGKEKIFTKPTLKEVAQYYGIQRSAEPICYDVVIIGAGPSGLGAAVYAGSEGLSTLIVDRIGPGGQAGSSSKIENYAGFPTGLTGRELAIRSYLQALKFGAQFIAPCSVVKIESNEDHSYTLSLCTGEHVKARTVIISTGISYRNLKVSGMDQLRGAGIFYNATQVEAVMCAQKTVHIIGAGNSAGQAAMFLSSHAKEVNILIRGDRISKSMSSYLWERIEKNPKINIRYRCEMVAVKGEQSLEAIHVSDKDSGQTTIEQTGGVFIFIGGTPCTDFLPDTILRDERGFILTGVNVEKSSSWKETRQPCELETTMPGIFVSGDCRADTTKRVAFAIGDGALAVSCVHQFLGTYS